MLRRFLCSYTEWFQVAVSYEHKVSGEEQTQKTVKESTAHVYLCSTYGSMYVCAHTPGRIQMCACESHRFSPRFSVVFKCSWSPFSLFALHPLLSVLIGCAPLERKGKPVLTAASPKTLRPQSLLLLLSRQATSEPLGPHGLWSTRLL